MVVSNVPTMDGRVEALTLLWLWSDGEGAMSMLGGMTMFAVILCEPS